jgi:hypothetical protein
MREDGLPDSGQQRSRAPRHSYGSTDPARLCEPEESFLKQASLEFLDKVGLVPTPDAVDQLSEVFVPCLAIMCRRGYDPHGATWRESGRMGALTDVRKKFKRLWDRAWKRGYSLDDPQLLDSGHDLINFTGFLLRSGDGPRWGEYGEPAPEVADRNGSQ